MERIVRGADVFSLFCRLYLNRKSGLPIRSSEMGLLIFLVRSEEPPTPLHAARFFRISKPMVTSMVRSLVKHGYVVKEPSAADGRSVLLCPTQSARLLVEETYQEHLKRISQLQQNLGQADYDQLVRLLERAAEVLEQEK